MNGPGPTPVTIASTSAPLTPASARSASIPGARTSAWLRVSSVAKLPSDGFRGVIGDQRGAGHGRGVDGEDQHQFPSRVWGSGAVSADAAGDRSAAGAGQRGRVHPARDRSRGSRSVRGSSSSSVSKSSTRDRAAGRRPFPGGRFGGGYGGFRRAGAAAQAAEQVHLQPAVAQVLHPAAAPLDHGHGAVHGVFQVDVVDFRGRPQPVGVHMHQVRAARPGTVGQVRVDADQDKGRRDDAGPDAQALPEALGEGGLARTQFAGQDQQVPGLQLRRRGRPRARASRPRSGPPGSVPRRARSRPDSSPAEGSSLM